VRVMEKEKKGGHWFCSRSCSAVPVAFTRAEKGPTPGVAGIRHFCGAAAQRPPNQDRK
jgi:hypothetical protein